MPYGKRDSEGQLVSLHLQPEPGADELLSYEDSDVRAFLGVEERTQALEKMDRDFIRVIEDVIDLLLLRNIIIFTDLPPAVQQKLTSRRRLRRGNNLPDLDDDVVLLP